MTLSIARPVPLKQIQITDDFWSEYIRLVREVVVPYQWEALNDRIEGAEPSHAMKNFKIAAGLETGEFYGMVFQDSDVSKWLEAVSYLLETRKDPELEQLTDEVIDIIALAQQKDGYLNTYFTLKEPENRWTNLAECHELYCAGHFIEAAVAYYNSTGKEKVLEVACRLADCIDQVFGPGPDKLNGYDGHQEIELALVKLYNVTQNERYLRLSQFFLDERGKEPSFYEMEYQRRNGKVHFPALDIVHDRAYSQAHKLIREQHTAEGHAVRAVYMCTGMADVAAQTGDAELLEACRRLWRNIVSKRMYITGAIGSMEYGESFSLDYDLPNDTAYAETCASIGLIFFAQRMLQMEAKSEYADVMEQALYNTVISGMSRDGKRFFYVNPLEVWPDAIGKNHTVNHVKAERQGWFGCACCPPNIARLLASLGHYVYNIQGRTIYANLYIGNQATLQIEGQQVKIEQQSQFPWNGLVRFHIDVERETEFTLALRIPKWCREAKLFVQNELISLPDVCVDGYAYIHRKWQPGDRVELDLAMPVNRMTGHPQVRETIGKVALQRGPLVYCIEEVDNGPNLQQVLLQRQSAYELQFEPDVVGGLQTISVPAYRLASSEWGDQLYMASAETHLEEVNLKFIPYYAWANRGRGEMSVWVKA
ncbi:glycoside hydrolase family 127 protein [Paenibacillus sp. CGMCC 1.16610]|uniref:Glycoside hydrolase family 127 protein n=1 Tax=Paenibacillus anseongense TaxID=2682845 RepID=A0ABW9UHW8_9BACL|nr:MULTISPECIES: beta-L-arabinofuranosidase domain-containing protein [Paenibacillus]MBA2936791.1 glycoside hydrolase family 127 protein [Paenibacillus sp. CGMCC 1.16610]MVQ39784.1 glycoside hydrolase family 127 protein [Paenibacillus anseongense]